MRIYSRAGFSIAQVVVAMGLFAIMGIVLMNMMKGSQQSSSSAQAKHRMLQLQANLTTLLDHSASWSRTVDAQSTGELQCLADRTDCTGRGGLIDVYDATGAKVVDSAPGQGFTPDGSPCGGYSAAGNDRCPLRYEVRWEPQCPSGGGPCISPTILIDAQLAYSPKNRSLAINTSNFRVNKIRGGGNVLADFCTGMGGEWISDRCDLSKTLCEANRGAWDVATRVCSFPTVADSCPEGQYATSVSIQNGAAKLQCDAPEVDFDPYFAKLVPIAYNDAKLKQIPQDKIEGCAINQASGATFDSALPCLRNRVPGTAGTCYYYNHPTNLYSGWYRAGSGFCRGGVFVNQAYTNNAAGVN